jgi:hypothetical protein
MNILKEGCRSLETMSGVLQQEWLECSEAYHGLAAV